MCSLGDLVSLELELQAPGQKFSRGAPEHGTRVQAYYLPTPTMPPQRHRILGEISGNSRKGPDLTPYKRGGIVALAEAGLSVSGIKAQNGTPPPPFGMPLIWPIHA